MYQRGMPIIKPKVLLGEGIEEVYFFNALLEHLGITDVQVDQYDGKNKIAPGLRAIKDRSGFINQVVSMGLTRDADDDANSAFQSVCAALGNAQMAAPQASGTFTVGQPRVGVFILPDCRQSGMLEDLCLASVALDLAMPCVDEFMRCVENNGRRPDNIAKARVHAWLASHIAPDKRLGEAALAGYWDWNNPAFDLLKQFLKQL